MSDENTRSLVEISVGETQLKVEGSEEFISEELSKILDQVDMAASTVPTESGEHSPSETTKPRDQPKSLEHSEAEQPKTTTDKYANSNLAKVADRLNVESSALEEYFVIDEGNIRIRNPMDIEPKYALLGYCSIQEILTDDQFHDNNKVKKKLIDVEKVDINEWGRKFLYRLRNQELIKDNPNTNKQRNKPFKITPSGRKDLINWINENN